MATPEELANRQEVATIKVEAAAHILDRVGNGTKTETVPTTNGTVPSVAKFLEDNKSEITAAAGATGRFCGSSVTAPTTRLNGDPLQLADEWHNPADNLRYSWGGTAWVALNGSAQALEQKVTDALTPNNGPGMLKVNKSLEYPFDSVGFSLRNVTDLRSGGNPQGIIDSDRVKFFDPLSRATAATIEPGSPVSIFDNNTTFGIVMTPAQYRQDSDGITKLSANGSSMLLLPSSFGGDIDMEICIRSLYQAGAADANAPQDASLALALRVQDDKNYCLIQINNSHSAESAALTIREAVNGVEGVRGSYGNIIIDANNPKMSNTNPTLRVILRGNRVTVSLNGLRVLRNVQLQTLRWGRHGIRVYKQGTLIKDFKVRENSQPVAPSVTVHKEGLLYGDGIKYVGWADAKPLNDGSVFVVLRESDLNTPDGGHQKGGRIIGARWRAGNFTSAPVTFYAADGQGVGDYQEQDCILSKVFYNGYDHLVLTTRRYRNTPSDNKCYISYCNIELKDPGVPANWSARVEVSFPAALSTLAGHAEILMAADGVSFITAFYGTRAGSSNIGVVLVSSTDLSTWSVRSIPVDPLATSNALTGGDPEPCLLRGPGASLLLYGRARTLASHDDGKTWCQYDLLGGNSQRGRHFPGSIRTENGGFLMYRRYTDAVTPADSVLVPIQLNDGISWKAPDFLGGVVVGTQEYGIGTPGGANPGGDSGCLRAAHLGGDQYLLLDYRQRVSEMAPRIYQYLISAE